MTFKNNHIYLPPPVPGSIGFLRASRARIPPAPGRPCHGCPSEALPEQNYRGSSCIFNSFNHSTLFTEFAKVSDTIATFTQFPSWSYPPLSAQAGHATHEAHQFHPLWLLEFLAASEPLQPALHRDRTGWQPRKPHAALPPQRSHFPWPLTAPCKSSLQPPAPTR